VLLKRDGSFLEISSEPLEAIVVLVPPRSSLQFVKLSLLLDINLAKLFQACSDSGQSRNVLLDLRSFFPVISGFVRCSTGLHFSESVQHHLNLLWYFVKNALEAGEVLTHLVESSINVSAVALT